MYSSKILSATLYGFVNYTEIFGILDDRTISIVNLDLGGSESISRIEGSHICKHTSAPSILGETWFGGLTEGSSGSQQGWQPH